MEKTNRINQALVFSNEKRRQKALTAVKYILFAAAGVMLSRAKIFDRLSPFGLAFAAAAPEPFSAVAALSAAAGYLITFSGAASIRYIACVAGAVAITRLIRRSGSAKKSVLLTPVSCSLCCASTGFAVLLAQGFSINGVLSFLCDCILAGGMTYFFSKSFDALFSSADILCSSKKSLICCVISCCVLLMSTADISFLNFNPARMAGAFLVMLFCFTLHEAGGAFAGICAGAALGAASGYAPLGGLFAAAGLLSGLFYPLGQLGIAAVFVSICGLSAVISPTPQGIAVIAESAAAAVIFVLIPSKKLKAVNLGLSYEKSVKISTDGDVDASSRLDMAKHALDEVAQCVEKVSGGLSSVDARDPALIKARVRQSVCADCPKSVGCVEDNKELRQDNFSAMIDVLRRDNFVSVGDLTPDFQRLCPRKQRLADSFNRIFADSTASVAALACSNQLRQVISDQFASMADILGEISTDMAKRPEILTVKSQTARDTAEDFLSDIKYCECRRCTDGRTSLTIICGEIPEKLNFSALVAELRRAINVKLSYPAVCDVESGVELFFEEKPQLRFDIGAAQKNCSGENLCGDYFEAFRTPQGSDMIVISDGMGTGGRAAVDSAMAASLFSTLIKAGLSCETSLKITNSALLAKSETESLSTLDIASLSPFSGEVEFYKAGAAPCFVRKGGRTALLEQSSLPAGILRDISFSTAGTKLSSGDILLMLSDGALTDSGESIDKLMRSWSGSAQGLADKICAKAAQQGRDKPDDITVVCVQVETA